MLDLFEFVGAMRETMGNRGSAVSDALLVELFRELMNGERRLVEFTEFENGV